MPTSAAATERGFTLVEMLVALMLLSLAGLTLVRFQTFGLGTGALLAERTALEIAADNLGVDLMIAETLPAKSGAGHYRSGERDYPYRYLVEAVERTGHEPLLQIRFEVEDATGRQVVRTILRPRTRAFANIGAAGEAAR